ncbi:hypothetical protein V6N13_128341 [Hibiscus sabdariffa]
MAAAAVYFFSAISSEAATFRFSSSGHQRHAASATNTSLVSFKLLSPKTTIKCRGVLKISCSESSHSSNEEKCPGRPKTQPKGKELREQQAELGNLQDAMFLDAIVKVFCTVIEPDYSLPWQKKRLYESTGSAFMIGDRKLLTNAHCVTVNHDTLVQVKRRGDDTKYVAKVLARGVDCDLALLSVESEEFWKGVKPLHLGHLPHLQDAVTVVGYPLGGDTILNTKGVVSRIEVNSYGYGASDLLCIHIDAAINPGNSGGPVFNNHGECIGVALQSYCCPENIGYVIPTTVVSHFLNDCERNEKYRGFPCLGIQLQKLENPALCAYFQVQPNEGLLVRGVEPTSVARYILEPGDVIVSFDDVPIGSKDAVPFISDEHSAFHYLISQKFSGDGVDLGIIRAGEFMKDHVVLKPRVDLVPYYIDGVQPSYLVIAGMVFTPLSDPLLSRENFSIGLKAKAQYSSASFKDQQIVILSKVLANEVNIGYQDMGNQQVLKFNGTRIKNIHHLALLVSRCKKKYLVFEFEDNYVAVLDREAATTALPHILKDYVYTPSKFTLNG